MALRRPTWITRPAILIVSTLAVAVLSGCYGQTDFASRVGNTAATFNGRGTTDHGPATTWFEYWPTAQPETVLRTFDRTIPSGVSGPVSTRVNGLTQGVSYTYRLCGRDQSPGASTTCAQTRRLLTGTANVQAWGDARFPDPHNVAALRDLDVDAFAPAAGHAFGHYFFYAAGSRELLFGSHEDGNVNCVSATGTSAVVSLDTGAPPEAGPFTQTIYLQLFDGGPAGSGQDAVSILFANTQRSNPLDCSSFSTAAQAAKLSGDVSVSTP